MAGRKGHSLQPSGGVFRQVHALTSLRFSHSEIQTVAGAPFESHENTPSRDYAKQIAFSWIDTREKRSAASECFVLLNDAEGIPSGGLTSLEQYNMVPVPWGERDQFTARLAA